jgi:hypothetical protein
MKPKGRVSLRYLNILLEIGEMFPYMVIFLEWGAVDQIF